ncbi:MAG TPA: SDR family NAD(P)-dependent oxidoreductase [Nitrospira sp.]|nr:SDR family NAD(P)-dependent oxidoreductase [Nitrospira sp.]
MGLKGKVVLITGGAGALGQTVVPAFVSAGASVFLGDLNPVQQSGVTALKADFTDQTQVRDLVNDVIQSAGRLDALINLVGGFATGRVVETDVSLWQRMMAMNLTSAFLLSHAVLPPMLERRQGRIVHIAARAGLEPFPGAAAYIVSKAGLIALICTLSTEVNGSGVTVNGVLPSTIDTPANRKAMPAADASKWVRPESIAQALIFLASDEAIQINGALIPIG